MQRHWCVSVRCKPVWVTWPLSVYFLLQLEYERKKKEEGKRARADRQQVLDMLFSAFEKHQYYNIKDLVDITKQPVVRLEGNTGALVITLFILADSTSAFYSWKNNLIWCHLSCSSVLVQINISPSQEYSCSECANFAVYHNLPYSFILLQ